MTTALAVDSALWHRGCVGTTEGFEVLAPLVDALAEGKSPSHSEAAIAALLDRELDAELAPFDSLLTDVSDILSLAHIKVQRSRSLEASDAELVAFLNEFALPSDPFWRVDEDGEPRRIDSFERVVLQNSPASPRLQATSPSPVPSPVLSRSASSGVLSGHDSDTGSVSSGRVHRMRTRGCREKRKAALERETECACCCRELGQPKRQRVATRLKSWAMEGLSQHGGGGGGCCAHQHHGPPHQQLPHFPFASLAVGPHAHVHGPGQTLPVGPAGLIRPAPSHSQHVPSQFPVGPQLHGGQAAPPAPTMGGSFSSMLTRARAQQRRLMP